MPISVIPQWEYNRSDNRRPHHFRYPDDPSSSLVASSETSFAICHSLL